MWRLKLYRGAWYAVTRTDGKTQRRALNTKDRKEADRAFKDFLARQSGPRETISEILDAYRKDKDEKLRCKKSADFCIGKLKPYWGHLRPDQVTRDLCRDYIKKRKIKSVRRELEVLRAALNWNDKNNTASFELPPPPPPRTRYLTREEYQKLLEASHAPHMRLFIILALHTAARASAILDLTWDRVYLDKNQIDFANGEQTNKRRAIVTMNQAVKDALIEAEKGRTSEYVIEYGGKKVGTIIKGFTRTADKAGLPDVTPHVLRHTAAVWMVEKGIPMSQISQFLGHTNTNVTERVYARYSPDFLLDAANALM